MASIAAISARSLTAMGNPPSWVGSATIIATGGRFSPRWVSCPLIRGFLSSNQPQLAKIDAVAEHAVARDAPMGMGRFDAIRASALGQVVEVKIAEAVARRRR